jgi:thymidylate synthase
LITWTPTTFEWRYMLRDILSKGNVYHQENREHEPRDRQTKELIGHQTHWDMAKPVVACQRRKVGYRFMTAEAAWVLSGSNLLAPVLRYAGYLSNFSDDGVTLSGAYGPKFVDQTRYVVGCLLKDPHSRQAVATLWRERPGDSKDIPCTIALQWLIRNGLLNCVVTMRSSDAWLGIPYDVFTFSCMSAAVAIRLRQLGGRVDRLGVLTITAGSQHLYGRDWDDAKACSHTEDEAFIAAPLDLAEFTDELALITHLVALTEKRDTPHKWLSEMRDHNKS